MKTEIKLNAYNALSHMTVFGWTYQHTNRAMLKIQCHSHLFSLYEIDDQLLPFQIYFISRAQRWYNFWMIPYMHHKLH